MQTWVLRPYYCDLAFAATHVSVSLERGLRFRHTTVSSYTWLDSGLPRGQQNVNYVILTRVSTHRKTSYTCTALT